MGQEAPGSGEPLIPIIAILLAVEVVFLALIWAELYRMGRGRSPVAWGGKPAGLLQKIAHTMSGGAPEPEFPTRPSFREAATSYEQENDELMAKKGQA